MVPMKITDEKLQACLEGFIAECARADELARSATGMRLLEAQRALDRCSDPTDLVAVRHWYQAAWDAYALSRGWLLHEPDPTTLDADGTACAA